jgi:hypothetical protein
MLVYHWLVTEVSNANPRHGALRGLVRSVGVRLKMSDA